MTGECCKAGGPARHIARTPLDATALPFLHHPVLPDVDSCHRLPQIAWINAVPTSLSYSQPTGLLLHHQDVDPIYCTSSPTLVSPRYIHLGTDTRARIKEFFNDFVKEWRPRFQVSQLVKCRIVSILSIKRSN
ncbi:hypothetical protein BJY52DRAFT_512153 [Lactarius psammicola]|nr:hypothetical protein BJY52DRAFT_512153 [Lactarius psammicola]